MGSTPTRSIMKLQLQSFEELVLRAVLALSNNTYGAPVKKLLEQATGQQITVGALYGTIHRLVEKEFLQMAVETPLPEHGGRVKLMLGVSESGKAALSKMDEIRYSLRVTTTEKTKL